MNKFLPFVIIIGLAMVFMSNRFGRTSITGQPATGAPGESGQTCGSVGCHFGNVFVPEPTVSLLDSEGNSVDTYIGGQDYTVVLNMATPGNPAGFGFQMVSLKDSDNTGINTFSNLPSFAQEAMALDRQYIEQNDIIQTDEISLTWTAPPANSGAVTFYGYVNAINGSMSPAGDGAQPVTQNFQEEETSSTSDLSSLDLQLYPNPASDFIIVGNAREIQNTSIMDLTGKEVLTSRQKEINISNLNSGIYIARVITTNGEMATQKFIKE